MSYKSFQKGCLVSMRYVLYGRCPLGVRTAHLVTQLYFANTPCNNCICEGPSCFLR
jgi:hypothetical protein